MWLLKGLDRSHRAAAVRATLAALLLSAAGALGAANTGDDLDEQERAGRQIYLHGTSPSGARLSARIGMGGLELAGASVACGNCHGEDGRGRPEGGVLPPNIRWSELSKPYGHHHPSGRHHGPFDEPLFERAVMEGMDPNGNVLDGAMPRYSMSAKDIGALGAYLKKLETLLDPGLSADVIRIGTLVPTSGRLAELGALLRAMWSAYFALLNQQGGIHGRRLELVVGPWPGDHADARARTLTWLAEADVFALLAPVSADIEAEMAAAATATRRPVIGPLTLFPEDARDSNSFVFHLLPGVAELAQVLALHAAQTSRLGQRPIALWHPDTPAGEARARSVQTHLRETGWSTSLAVPFPARGIAHDTLAHTLKERDVATVLVLGPGADLAALAAAAVRADWTPHLLVPGPLASRDIVELPLAFRDRVTVAYPTAPHDQRDAALREYAALLPERTGARGDSSTQRAAYAAGLLLVEALKRSGRELSRHKLIASLEAVQGYETGLLPALSYNADRRIGAMGAYLLRVDLEHKSLRALGGYQPLP